MEENKNNFEKYRKYILPLVIILMGVGIASAIYYQNSQTKTVQKKVEVKKSVEEFGKFSPFVRMDLTNEEKQALKNILAQREDRIIQIKEILKDGYDTGNIEEAFYKVEQMREKCRKRIEPYINPNMMEQFREFCRSEAEKVDAEFIQK